MATADELLAMTSDNPSDVLTVNVNNRVISIPAAISILGVEADDDVKRLQFSIPRRYGEFDLSEFVTHINYKNARGGGDVYLVDDMSVSGDTITFSWLVDRFAFQYAGEVTFSICMKKYSGDIVVKEFNTTPATLPVLVGLETSESAIKGTNPAVLDTVLMRLYAVEAASGLGRDGYYTVIRVSDNADGVVFTLVNQEGETVTMVKHGRDAYTPVYKRDYFTDDEQAEFKNEIMNNARQYIDNWAPRPVIVTLAAEGWVDNQQTVLVNGVAADNVIVVSPEPDNDNYSAYVENGIRCVSQSENALVFQCSSIPTDDIFVNVAVYHSVDNVMNPGGLIVTDDGNGNVTIA
jgi:hypothetical protein